MKKILVADDSLTIQKVIRLALSNESYEIQAVSDGKDALQQIALTQPHIVLIDVSLPGFSAFEVKRKMNESPEFSDVQFILMSSAFEQVDEGQVAEVRFSGRLVKPFDPGNLREVLQRVMANIKDKSARSPQQQRSGGIALTPPEPDLVPKHVSMDDEDEDEITEDVELPPQRKPLRTSARRADEDRTIRLDLGQDDASGYVIRNPAPTSDAGSMKEDLWDGHDVTMKISSPGGGEEDIRQLTESTIKLSGLDDYQWSVQEGAKRDSRMMTASASDTNEPVLEPPRNLLDVGGSTFQMGGTAPMPSHRAPDSHRTFYEDAPEESGNYSAQPPQPAIDMSAGGDSIMGMDAGGAEITPISSEHLEAMINRHVQEALEKMARKMLPDLAERLIKEEIQRLLANPPA